MHAVALLLLGLASAVLAAGVYHACRRVLSLSPTQCPRARRCRPAASVTQSISASRPRSRPRPLATASSTPPPSRCRSRRTTSECDRGYICRRLGSFGRSSQEVHPHADAQPRHQHGRDQVRRCRRRGQHGDGHVAPGSVPRQPE